MAFFIPQIMSLFCNFKVNSIFDFDDRNMKNVVILIVY